MGLKGLVFQHPSMFALLEIIYQAKSESRRCCKVSRLTLILTSFTSTLRHGRYTITQTKGEMRKKWHTLSWERFSTAVHVCEPSLNALMLKCYVAWPGDHSMFKPSARQLDSLSSCERRYWVESRQSSSLLSITVQRMTPFAAETCAHPAFSASNPACGSRDRVFDRREPHPASSSWYIASSS